MSKNWFERNWKWLIPSGCIGIIIIGALIAFIFIFMVFHFMKSSDVYKSALMEAKNNALVMEAIGSPIKDAFLISGSISTSGHSGNAEFSIPIYGPEGKAKIFVNASKYGGKWSFSYLVVEVEATGQKIDLLE